MTVEISNFHSIMLEMLVHQLINWQVVWTSEIYRAINDWDGNRAELKFMHITWHINKPV